MINLHVNIGLGGLEESYWRKTAFKIHIF